MIQSQVDIGHRLSLHPLGRIYHQERPLASRQTSGYLIGEIHMAWGVNQVEGIFHPAP